MDTSILGLLAFPPRFTVDIGCNTGSRSMVIKNKFPDSKVWGVEPNRYAADIARRRIDYVVEHTIDQIDWADYGVTQGEIDTILLFDVLEHIYDPWSTLLSLRNLVSPHAQLVVSTPNARNALLLQDLVQGTWRYQPSGLLDVTHIRFFTRDDLMRMFYQTGFRLAGQTATLDPACEAIMKRYRLGPFPCQVELDGLTVKIDSEADLLSLCATQNICILQPATYEQLSADERRWIDGPHPHTQAYGSVAPSPTS